MQRSFTSFRMTAGLCQDDGGVVWMDSIDDRDGWILTAWLSSGRIGEVKGGGQECPPCTAIRALHTGAGGGWRIDRRKTNPSVRVFGDVAPD